MLYTIRDIVISMPFDKEQNVGVKSEPLATRSHSILLAYDSLPIAEGIAALPDLSNWMNWNDDRKLVEIRKALSGELYQIYSKYCDERNEPTSDSNFTKNKYHIFIPPWLGEYYRIYGKENFDKEISKGKVDPMVRELRNKKLLKDGLDPKSELISWSSSTGNTQYLSQYDQGLQMLEKMRLIVEGNNWDEVKVELINLIVEQDKSLKFDLGYSEDDIWVRMQSGTDLPLLNGLFGSYASQITNETGTASWAAASFRHISTKSPTGHRRKKGDDGLTKKLPGYEKFPDAIELEMRKSNGDTLDSELIKDETIRWIEKHRNENPGCRLTLGVTAGGKTGLEWRGKKGRRGGVDDVQGGLQFDDALELRRMYGGKDGMGILIVVDNSQGRLSRDEISYLKTQQVIIHGTGSKVPEGPGFSAYAYIPKEFKKLIQQTLNDHPELLDGLSEYVTQSDMRDLLNGIGIDGKPALNKLSDMPDVFSALKWEPVRDTLEKIAKLDSVELKTKVRDFVGMIEEKMTNISTELVEIPNQTSKLKEYKRQPKVINGHTWEVVLNNEIKDDFMDPQFEMLLPFRIKIDGKFLKEAEYREIHKLMSWPGESGQMVNIGQYVAGANVLRIAPGMMTELGLVNAEVSLNYMNDLSNSVVGKLGEVMEGMLKKSNIDKAGYGWTELNRLNLEEIISRNVFLQVEETKKNDSLKEKVEGVVKVYSNLFREQNIMPIVLVSGKNLASLDLIYKSWEASGREGDLQVAFVDHPYILIDKNGKNIRDYNDSAYGMLLKTLTKYPKCHLNIYGITDELRKLLTDSEIDSSKYTVSSKQYSYTRFEMSNPRWYHDVWSVDPDTASAINERHKGIYTDQMIHELCLKYSNFNVAICRGNRAGQQKGREHTLPLSVSDNFDFLGAHILTAFTEDEINQLIVNNDIPRLEEYIDWLKEVQKVCGLDLRFKMVHPQWYIDMRVKNLNI